MGDDLFVILLTGSGETKCVINIYYLILPYIFVCLFMFTIGIGFIISTISVFLRDMFYIYGIVIIIWNYFTPVFYSIAMLPEKIQTLFKLNPLYIFINSARDIILFNTRPSGTTLLVCGAIGLFVMVIGAIIFKSQQDKFIYHV